MQNISSQTIRPILVSKDPFHIGRPIPQPGPPFSKIQIHNHLNARILSIRTTTLQGLSVLYKPSFKLNNLEAKGNSSPLNSHNDSKRADSMENADCIG
jgi:hypothetical protein